MMFFRFRGALKGAEQFCYGILDADGQEGRKWKETSEFFARFNALDGKLGIPPKAQVCILYDFDSLASFRIQRQSEIFDSETEMKRIHAAFYRVNVQTDIIPSSACFEKYRVVILCNTIICTSKLKERLVKFTENGGVVIASFRTAVKDEDNNLIEGEKLPAGLTSLFGITVEETESLWERDGIKLKGESGAAERSAKAGVFREMCRVETAEALYTYDDEFYGNYAAITKNRYGSGIAFYLGCSPEDRVLDEIVARACSFANVRQIFSPCGVEVTERRYDGGALRFIINHNKERTYYGGREIEPFGYVIEEIE